MDYNEAIAYINQVSKSGMHQGLSRMQELCRRLGNPEKKLKFIHIAGTNGKGSVAAYISSILAVNGHLTGRFVSPVVFQYEECIQYEDPRGIHYIEKELLAEIVTKVAKAADAMEAEGMEHPTVFEIETAMAFLAFVHWNCQMVILEAGLGGLEDSTNVIDTAVAAVITPISLDHTRILGDTIEKIATQKAGIIKENMMVTTYQPDMIAEQVIKATCDKKKNECFLVKEEDMGLLHADLEGSTFSFKSENFRTFMAGTYQIKNACLAIEACRHLPQPFTFDEEQLILGIRMAAWRGRFEVICTNPLIIIDGAHNPAGATAFTETIKELLPGRKCHAVMGVFADKNYEKMVQILQPVFEDVVTITPPGARGLDKDILADEWKKNGCKLATSEEDVMHALKVAMGRCGENEVILMFGSLSFFKELKWR